jgi:plasmid stability protein
MSDQFEREIFKTGLRKLLQPDGHFSIIDFDLLTQLAAVPVTTEERDKLRILHCVHYRSMSREMKEALIAKLAEIFARGRDPMADAVAALDGVAAQRGMGIGQSEILRLVR